MPQLKLPGTVRLINNSDHSKKISCNDVTYLDFHFRRIILKMMWRRDWEGDKIGERKAGDFCSKPESYD